MLTLFLLWAFVITAATVTGACFIDKDREPDAFIYTAALGLLGLPAPLLALSLLGPLTPWHFVGVFVILPAVLFAARRPKIPRPEWRALGVLMAANAFNSAGPVMLYDTGLYHYPFIAFLREFGTVAGQAHLHFRFGFSSSWFAPPAALDAGFLAGRSAATFGGLLMTLAMYHFVRSGARWLSRQASPTDRFFVGAYPIALLFGGMVQRFEVSPSPNFPAAISVLLAVTASPAAGFLIASAGAASKVTMIPLMGLCALRLRPKDWRILLMGALLLAPTVIANVVSTGCPLFPTPLLCAETDTAMGAARAAQVNVETRNWARFMPNEDQRLFYFGWVTNWVFRYLNLPLTIVAVASLVILAIIRPRSWPALMAVVGMGYVFLASPDYRFGFGYLAAAAGAAFAALGINPPRIAALGSAARLATLGALCLVGNTLSHETAYRRLFHLPFDTWSAARFLRPALAHHFGHAGAAREINGFTYKAPLGGDQCWGIAPPCSPYTSANFRLCEPARGIPGGFCRASTSQPSLGRP